MVLVRDNSPQRPPLKPLQVRQQPVQRQAWQFLECSIVTRDKQTNVQKISQTCRFHKPHRQLFTLSSDTRSAACKSVKPEMSSTILLSLGSAEGAGAGGGGAADVEGSAAAVARHLDELANVLGLHTFWSSASNSKPWSSDDKCLPETTRSRNSPESRGNTSLGEYLGLQNIQVNSRLTAMVCRKMRQQSPSQSPVQKMHPSLIWRPFPRMAVVGL